MAQSHSFVIALALACAAPGCKSTPFEPPFEKAEPGVWKNPRGKEVPAPAAANAPWRVMVLQEWPRPKKNPQWKTIPVGESGLLEMPERSSFKCLYNPAVYRPSADEFLKGVEVWEVLRGVRCSNDGFRTYTEALHAKAVAGDGTYTPRKGAQAELSFSDLIMGKRVRVTVILRPD